MFLKKLIYFLAGMLALSIAGCTGITEIIPVTGGAQTPDSNSLLANTRWKLVSYGEPGSELPVVEGSDVTLLFEAGSQAGGSGGCNTFGAQYDVSGNRALLITEVVSTEIACEDGLMEMEAKYLEALQSADRFEVFGDHLTIHYGNGQGVLNFSKIKSSLPNSVNI